MKFFDNTIIRYLIVGTSNTVLTYGIYLFCLLVVPYHVAYTISYMSGIIISYVLNAIFVFRQPLRWKTAFKYPVVYIVQYILGAISLTVIVEMLGVDERLASLLNVIILLPVTFILTRYILVPKNNTEVEALS